MFRGFIVLGVTFGVGYSMGYLKGQNHTEELKDLIHDIRDSEETKEFFTDLINAIKTPKEEDKEEPPSPRADAEGSAVEDVLEENVTTPVPDQGE